MAEVDGGTCFEVVEIVDAIFCFTGAGLRLSAHPFLLAAEGVLQARQLCGHGFDALGSSAEVVVVVAVVGVDLAVVDFDDAVAHAVEEITVVSDHKEGCAGAFEIVFYPLNDFDVEVVCRFIED